MKTNRRTAVKQLAGTAALLSAASPIAYAMTKPIKTMQSSEKQGINHSVCKWCFNDIPLDTFCTDVKKMGISSVRTARPR